jgi:putative heme-binding domain-containing protein
MIQTTVLAFLIGGSAAAQAPEERPIWTTSRLTGSPEPPPPLRAKREFPALNFQNPVELVRIPGSDRYVLVEEHGMLYSFLDKPDCPKAELFIDLPKEIRNLAKVDRCRGVHSSYSIAFDPDFEKNRLCYIMYILASTDRRKPLENGSRVSKFKVTPEDPPRCDPESEEILFTWVADGHNGCDLKFGKDGYLYISTGDAEEPSPPDKRRTGQDISDLLSSILRIDVHKSEGGRAYAIPADNPFVGMTGARPEVWCYGLRNPWRMNFDPATGRLWVADVGWERWEMIHCTERGGNCGWSVMEGPEPCILDAKRGPTPILPPAHAIPHPEAASITGGFVYRGKDLRGFQGHYFCGDWETRKVWALPVQGGTTLGARRTVARTPLRIVAFAEDPQGELLLVDHEGGGIHRLVLAPPGAENTQFPRTLGETGLFTSVRDQVPSPGVIPYEIRAPRWADGATGQRWLALADKAATIKLVDKWRDWPKESVWPKDSVLANTLSMEGRRLETQILHFDGLSWNGYSYIWREDQSDADLGPAEGASIPLGNGRSWKVQPRAACAGCHNPWPGYSLTIHPFQLKKVDRFQKWRILAGDLPRAQPMVNPYDENEPLDARARSYLAVNCAPCHRMGGGGSARIDLRHDIPLGEMRVQGVRPTLGSFDLTDAHLISGGDPARSVLFYRISKLGQGRMPHIGSEVVDEAGMRLLSRWIQSLPAVPADASAASSRALDRKAIEAGAFDRLLGSTTGSLELLGALETLSEPVRKEAIRQALALPPGPIRDLFERFEPPSQRRVRLGTSIDPRTILKLEGDPRRGRALLASPALQCSKCHRMGTGPETMGPDLSKIGAKYNRAQLLESILEPSKTIDPKYAGYVVQTKGGEVYSVILVSKSETEFVFRDAEKEIRLPTASLERMAPMKDSLMPEGLLQYLTAQEAADLVAALEAYR